MGKVISIMVRQSRRVFVQERAERIISKPKPTMHPLYPTEEKIMKQIKAEHPELEEKIREHATALDERVGHLRITSKEVAQLGDGRMPKFTRPKLESCEQKGARLLPQARTEPPELEFGFFEPPEDKIARGRILFSKAMQMLEMRRQQQDTAQEIAKQCGLDDKDTKNILEYFAPFTKFVEIPDAVTVKESAHIDDAKEIIGHRAILQRQRQISPLEQQRLTARLVPGSDSDSKEVERGGDKEKTQPKT